MSEKRTPDSKNNQDPFPNYVADYDALNKAVSDNDHLQSKLAKLECGLLEIKVLVRACQLFDMDMTASKHGYAIFMHDILIEKIDSFEELLLEVA